MFLKSPCFLDNPVNVGNLISSSSSFSKPILLLLLLLLLLLSRFSRVRLFVTLDCSLPGTSVHGIFQARVLEWGAITFSEYVVRQIQSSFCWRAAVATVKVGYPGDGRGPAGLVPGITCTTSRTCPSGPGRTALPLSATLRSGGLSFGE